MSFAGNARWPHDNDETPDRSVPQRLSKPIAGTRFTVANRMGRSRCGFDLSLLFLHARSIEMISCIPNQQELMGHLWSVMVPGSVEETQFKTINQVNQNPFRVVGWKFFYAGRPLFSASRVSGA